MIPQLRGLSDIGPITKGQLNTFYLPNYEIDFTWYLISNLVKQPFPLNYLPKITTTKDSGEFQINLKANKLAHRAKTI